MYKDVISYRLAENVSDDRLLKVASDVLENWMRQQPGFVKWEIHKESDRSYTDIVYWESKDAAKKAEADMVNIPNASDWFSCYEEGSISSKNLYHVATFR